ncbi:hypothetical protein DPMN_115047 [Dreissena polymorpha]|uniref:RING-type domain-containing protein n=1 Tax=Dreissena polymorpha TaxID=45954 RepID=A0A9D4KKH9_DREPO|nr:hypothetical protein DPMN_115047 [Dreissena polymorpha]
MDLVSKIKESLSCTICKNIFYIPVQSPCGHTFCQQCIHAYIVKSAKIDGYDITDYTENRTPNFKPKNNKVGCPFKGCNYVFEAHEHHKPIQDCAASFYNHVQTQTILELCVGKSDPEQALCSLCEDVGIMMKASHVCFGHVQLHCVKCQFIHDQLYDGCVSVSVDDSSGILAERQY